MTLEIGPSLAALLAMCITGWVLQRPVIDQAQAVARLEK